MYALTWDPETDRGLVPSYARVLSTISELALVCGLTLSDLLDPQRFYAWRCMPYAPAEGFSLQTVEREDLPSEAIIKGLKESGPDWLGRYRSSGTPVGIELHLGRCRQTANFLGISPKALVEVVLTHEAAHFVSHFGIGGWNRQQWEDFSRTDRESTERIAQIACCGVFTIFGKPKLIRVMQKLARYQSEVYNNWTDFQDECSKSLNDPLDLIATLTVKVGDASGRKVRIEPEDMMYFPTPDY